MFIVAAFDFGMHFPVSILLISLFFKSKAIMINTKLFNKICNKIFENKARITSKNRKSK